MGKVDRDVDHDHDRDPDLDLDLDLDPNPGIPMQTTNWLDILPRNSLLPRRPDVVPDMPKAFTRRSLLRFIERQRKILVDRFRDNEVAIERGRSRCTPALAEITKAAFENLRAPEPPRRLHVEVEGAVAVFARAHTGSPLVQYWVACCGLPFAVRATCRWAELALRREEAPDGDRAWLVERDQPGVGLAFADLHQSPWVQLRKAVAAADRETYEVARHVAARLRRRAPLPVRCWLDFAFSSERAWAEEDALLVIPGLGDGEALPAHFFALLASLRDAEAIELIVGIAIIHDCGHLAAHYAWEILASLGPAAEPSLERLCATEVLERLKIAARRETTQGSAA
jgi:hypothetical protein